MFRRKPEKATPHEVYSGLRSRAPGASNSGALPAPPPDHPTVLGVVVDIPSKGGTATIVALTDNTTSLYTSTGGGTIGAEGDDLSVPPAGIVRFHVLTVGGPLVADVPERTPWEGGGHPLLAVIAATQQVITAIRTSTPP